MMPAMVDEHRLVTRGWTVVAAAMVAVAAVVVAAIIAPLAARQRDTGHGTDTGSHHGAIAATHLGTDHAAEHAAHHGTDDGIAASRPGGLRSDGEQQNSNEGNAGHFHGDLQPDIDSRAMTFHRRCLWSHYSATGMNPD
jgi:hypothetical protein